ncbi:hypothetical protein GGI02_003723 [Coemansia sp. RSA 2322]|uniref:Uncharacterized protein n=1 Tax=Coemansia thaxteri TaxID=2663907 RepID=A0A9W8BIQ5_9FUNG|nr:hypothetical protein H4R26_002464 [Coemansia thaxteri]KAJ2468360.1 hypothetical protein GGI02_003723 [Coemansia sp. RSA 2322]KAJ2477632.1 hypothetical protein EV174_004561 [Coemansia sp. RSA 2320]
MSHALVPPQFPNTGDLLFSKIAPGLYPALPALPAQQPSPVPYALGSLVLDPQADGRVVSGSPITPMSCSALPTTPISCPMLSSPLMRDSGIGRLGVDSTDYYYHYRQQPLHQQQSPVTVVYMPNAVHGSGIEAKQSAAFISELMSLQTK